MVKRRFLLFEPSPEGNANLPPTLDSYSPSASFSSPVQSHVCKWRLVEDFDVPSTITQLVELPLHNSQILSYAEAESRWRDTITGGGESACIYQGCTCKPTYCDNDICWRYELYSNRHPRLTGWTTRRERSGYFYSFCVSVITLMCPTILGCDSIFYESVLIGIIWRRFTCLGDPVLKLPFTCLRNTVL